MMEHLDKFECVGTLYDVMQMEVLTQFNQSILCVAYILNEFHPNLLELPMLQSYTKEHASSYVWDERSTYEEIISQVKSST